MRRELAPLDKKARKLLEPAIAPNERILAGARGLSSAIIATAHRVLICRWGVTSGAFFGSQVNSWEFSHITGIEFRRGVGSAAILIQSRGAQIVTRFGNQDKGPTSVWEAPNALFLLGNDGDKLAAMPRQLVSAYQSGSRFDETQSAPTTRPASLPSESTYMPHPADDLRKYAALRDDGLITEDEYQAKKASILGGRT